MTPTSTHPHTADTGPPLANAMPYEPAHRRKSRLWDVIATKLRFWYGVATSLKAFLKMHVAEGPSSTAVEDSCRR